MILIKESGGGSDGFRKEMRRVVLDGGKEGGKDGCQLCIDFCKLAY